MATYKVIQDIEAEDKFVGPLSLKQFIFAMAGAFFGWLTVFFAAKAPFLIIISLPICLFGFFLAVPWSKEQPTEIWFLAKLRFYFKPKAKLWDQSGQEKLVTITAPKKPDIPLTKSYSQDEVKSRLQALAETIDSRGWVVKHSSFEQGSAMSDRLIDINTLPQNVPDMDLENVPDMLDEKGTANSSKIEAMIVSKSQDHKAKVNEKLDRIRSGEALSSASNPAPATISANDSAISHMRSAALSKDEAQLVKKLEQQKANFDLSQKNMHRIDTETQTQQKTSSDNSARDKAQATMTTSVRPDIIGLARNNDLNVATIARQANKPDQDNEVVISLH